MMLLPILAVSFVQAEPTVEWQITPAAEPKPLLKYELLPNGRDRRAGNAALGYAQTMQLRPPFPTGEAKAKAWQEKDELFRSQPLEALSVRELTEHLKPYRSYFRQADLAARCRTCDWQRDGPIGGEGLIALLPELQQHRELARAMQLRVRLAVLDGKFDEAAVGLQTALQHAKHVGEGPSLVPMLVGLAIGSVQIAPLQDFVRRPGSPNLGWALATLPRPFVDARPALDGESNFLRTLLPGLPALEAGPVTADQAVAQIEKLVTTMQETGDTSAWRTLTSKVGVIGYSAIYRDEAKAALIAMGRSEASLAGMPPAQLCLLRIVDLYREHMDEQTVLFAVPHAQANTRREGLREKRLAMAKSNDPLVAMLAEMLPAIEKVHFAFQRFERQLDVLRIVETVRQKAAESGGQFPSTFATELIDPMTGKPFAIAVRDGAITIAGVSEHRIEGLKLTLRK
jgi:hypothetical protein